MIASLQKDLRITLQQVFGTRGPLPRIPTYESRSFALKLQGESAIVPPRVMGWGVGGLI